MFLLYSIPDILLFLHWVYYFKPLHGAASQWRLFLSGIHLLLFSSAYRGLVFLIMACIALLLLCIFGCPYIYFCLLVCDVVSGRIWYTKVALL